MRVQVVYKKRQFSYDQDWLDAFSIFAKAELIEKETKLDGDLIVIHHSMTGQDNFYPDWLKRGCLSRKGKLVVFHTNEFKFVKEREALAKELKADFICTQLQDGRLYSMPTISMPHALNPLSFSDKKGNRPITVGFRGARYKPGIHDERNRVIEAFSKVPGSDIVLDNKKFLSRNEWADFLNQCKAIPGAEAGCDGARIISPRHLEAIGCGTLQVLLSGEYCGVLSPEHYLTYTTVQDAMEFILDEKLRSEITEKALVHVLENHTYKHRIEKLLRLVDKASGT